MVRPVSQKKTSPEEKQKRKRRRRTYIAVRTVLSLIGISIASLVVIQLYFGETQNGSCVGECESLYSLFTWVLGFFLLFVVVIAAAAAVGIVFSVLRQRKSHAKSITSQLHGPEKDQ